ncbi:nucleoside phosphorylase domain-containing protein [Aspergillus candidus]|uniref:Nucleoside phosphorylase domain-containing protein n=1 Tax=Aspergillus candidus TaxID=41067 RepID=A0A2I2F178_ASPCN|nr:nucleoside phosphorylase domain-containing protein [Aspergillus candidus]PLB34358.1 nucleoside phosphorylase domain-containing protein [Aspergillus candidus]
MSSDKVARFTHDDYTVAWICPMVAEQTAAIVMLDSEHERLPQPSSDHNVYTLGSVNGHNVVVVGLHTSGNNPAAVVATQMRTTFPRLRFGVLVGTAGGVPTRTTQGDIRLGHVVVSQPMGEHSGVVQYDHGKAEIGQFRRTGYLASPPTVLLNAAREMDIRRQFVQKEDPLLSHLSRIETRLRHPQRYRYPGADKDRLFKAEYLHPDPKISCRECGCDSNSIVRRRAGYIDDDDDDDDDADVFDQDEQFVVHRGTIATGERVINNGHLRDKLARQYGILCFEMEAAGASTDFPCLVVRGISHYSDSHKNDRWQDYAAAAAAAYARELFFHMPVYEVKQVKMAEHISVRSAR